MRTQTNGFLRKFVKHVTATLNCANSKTVIPSQNFHYIFHVLCVCRFDIQERLHFRTNLTTELLES